MPRALKRQRPINRFEPRRQQKLSQLSLDPWFRSSEEATNTPTGDGSALLLSAADELDGVAIRNQDALSGQDTTQNFITPGILSETSLVSPDTGCDVNLETKVVIQVKPHQPSLRQYQKLRLFRRRRLYLMPQGNVRMSRKQQSITPFNYYIHMHLGMANGMLSTI